MEVTTLAFDTKSNASITLMYGKSYSMSIERIAVEFADGSDFDEISVYALSTSAFWFQNNADAYVNEFRLVVAGEVFENPPANGSLAVVYDFPSGTTLDEVRSPSPSGLVPAYPTKLISGFTATVSDYPYMTIVTDQRSIGAMTSITNGFTDHVQKDMVFIYDPLITKSRGVDLDITYTPAPVVAHATARFSLLISYVNKTTINKRCKVIIYSRPVAGDPLLIRGSLFVTSSFGAPYPWENVPPPLGTVYAEAIQGTCKFGAVGPPSLIDMNVPVTFTDYDYYGGVIDSRGAIWLIPSNIASKSGTWHGIVPGISTQTFFAYPRGRSNAEFAVSLPYRGGVYFGGRVFFCPYGQSSFAAGKWHYINLNPFEVRAYDAPVLPDYINALLPKETDGYDGFPAYCGGSVTSTGLIVLAPFGRSQDTTWHYIDTNTLTVREYGVAYPPERPLMYRGAYTNVQNNYVLFCPNRADSTGYWHYFKGSTNAVGYYLHFLPETEVAEHAYSHITTLLTPTNASALIPFGQSEKGRIQTIVHSTGSPLVFTFPSHPGINARKFIKGVLTPSGRIFLIPGEAFGELLWKYIDYPQKVGGTTNVVTYNTSKILNDNHCDAVMTAWGDIYLIPTFTARKDRSRGYSMHVIRTYPGKYFDQTVATCPEINHI